MPSPLSIVMNPDQIFSPDISAFQNWSNTMERFAGELASQDIFTASWKRSIMGLSGLPFNAMLIQINEMMNAQPYVSDIDGWQKSDYWETPGEFIKHGGDCEDYSLAKYLALRQLNIPESLMRIVIVKDTRLGVHHALLLVRGADGNVNVLDNQNRAVRHTKDVHRYRPIYSINDLGWWYHA